MTPIDKDLCDSLQIHLVDYARGTAGRLTDRIERHLQQCDTCREHLAFVRGLRAMVAGSPEVGPRLGFRHRLEAVVAEAEEAADPVRRVRRAGLWAAGLGALFVLFFGSLLPGVPEALNLIGRLDSSSLPIVGAAIGVLFLLSSPLLILKPGRAREGSR